MGYVHRAVKYLSKNGAEIAGVLFQPAGQTAAATSKKPGIVLMGPIGFVKEQSPLQYASRLATQGFVTLIFDPSGHGASAGEPRRVEDPDVKTADMLASAEFLRAQPDVSEVHALGLCQGINWTVKASVEAESPFQKTALVAGNYLTPQVCAAMTGNKLDERLAEADAALAEYEKSGQVKYRPIVPPAPGAQDVCFLNVPIIGTWYNEWDTTKGAERAAFARFRGQWENKLAVHSEAKLWRYDITPDLERFTKPILVIHADKAATGPKVPRMLFDKIASNDKTLVWLPEAQEQFMFYEDPFTIDTCVASLTTFFAAGDGAPASAAP